MSADHDPIDEKLARLGRRIEDRKASVRDELSRTGLLHLAEAARERFGAKLAYLKTDRIEVGADIPAQPEPRPVERKHWRVHCDRSTRKALTE